MGSVTVKGNSFTVYNTDLPAVKLYLSASIGAGPDAFNASTDDDLKGKCVVAAKRYIDEQRWQGLKTVPSQADEWPRTGVVDGYKLAVDSSTVPTAIKSAEAELAAIFMADPTVNAALRSGSNVHRVDAKGVSVAFFRPTDTFDAPTMPVVVQRLIGAFLASAVGNSAAAKYYSSDDSDVDLCPADSAFDDDAIMDRSNPMG